VENGVQLGCSKLLTNNDISLKVRVRLCSGCVQDGTVYVAWKWDLAHGRGEWGGTLAGRDESD